MSKARPSTKEKALATENRLKIWVRETALGDIPRNQTGGASKAAILKTIGAPRSCAHSNPRISEAFRQLDMTLSAKLEKTLTAKANGEPFDERAMRNLVAVLRNENASLIDEIRRLRWCDDTGRWAAKE